MGIETAGHQVKARHGYHPRVDVKVSVTNLGPIRSVELDLRPLIVLLGANNTGKTYFATVVHRLLDAANSSNLRRRRTRSTQLPPQLERLFSPRYTATHRVAGSRLPLEVPDFVPNSTTLGWVRTYLRDALESYGEALVTGIEYAFGVQGSELCRRTPSGHRASGGSRVTVTSSDPEWTVEVNLGTGVVTASPPKPLEWLNRFIEATRRSGGSEMFDRVLGYTLGSDPVLFNGWPERAVHLPAGRTGIMQSYQVLASTVVRQSTAAGIRPIEVPTLPGTAADFLSLLLSLPRARYRPGRERRSRVLTAVKKFEDELAVHVEVDPELGASEVHAVMPEGRFPLSRTSSMVSELAPILLTARHLLGFRDHLTVDEPEAHLHPAMQTATARFFASLLRSDVRLVITTHSDYFVTELNNLIRAGALRKSELQPTLFADAVEPTMVTALRFERSRRGCIAEPLIVDPINGIDESTFGDVVETLYRESMALTDALNDEA